MTCLPRGFFVLAPREQITRQVFSAEMSRASIERKVARRVSEYPAPEREAKEHWLQEWFLPTLAQMKVDCLCWQDIIDSIRAHDGEFGSELSEFYAECLRFNRLQEPDLTAVGGSPPNAGDESAATSLGQLDLRVYLPSDAHHRSVYGILKVSICRASEWASLADS
jgi:hypothetical protein